MTEGHFSHLLRMPPKLTDVEVKVLRLFVHGEPGAGVVVPHIQGSAPVHEGDAVFLVRTPPDRARRDTSVL